MIVLALTTSTPIASVALVDSGRVLAFVTHDDPRGHAEHLFDLIDAALAAAGHARADVQLVACDVGPGSFTGVRIGVASAKGIAEALGVPLCGVLSLDAMAAEARSLVPDHPLVAAAIDAKKGELYVAVTDGERALLPPSHVARGAASERVLAAASGRPLVTIADAGDVASFVPGAARALVAPPSAAWIGHVAEGRFAAERGSPAFDPAEVAPLYVRAPDAVPTTQGSPVAI